MNRFEHAKMYLEVYGKYTNNEYIEGLAKKKIVSVEEANGQVHIDFEDDWYMVRKEEFNLSKSELTSSLIKLRQECLEHSIFWKKECEEDLKTETEESKIVYLKGEIKHCDYKIKLISTLMSEDKELM